MKAFIPQKHHISECQFRSSKLAKKETIILPHPKQLHWDLSGLDALLVAESLPISFNEKQEMVLLPPSSDILIESGQIQLQKPDVSLVNNTTNSNQDISDESRIRTEFQSISYAKQDPFPKVKSNKSTLNHSDSHSLFKEDTQSVWETIRNEVIPKWNQYMITKNRRKEADPSVRSRLDTFRKKILRDLREFFRILFRRRFHLSKYRTTEGVTK